MIGPHDTNCDLDIPGSAMCIVSVPVTNALGPRVNHYMLCSLGIVLQYRDPACSQLILPLATCVVAEFTVQT